jgi:hypothetical protein
MKRIAAALLVVLAINSGFAQKLSDEASISVITCGPYDEVYLAFGHSAFRVHDPRTGIDYAFNYGVFDFDKPGFLVDFALGDNMYMLGVHDYQLFQESYIEHNRFIHEQVLNLTPEQRQKVFDYLMWNALPENREYPYDYFYDNCATRIRDVIVKVLGSDVTFDGSYITTDYSIRQLTDIYLKPQPWGDLGIDVCLGLPMDKKATPFEYMFLPDYIESGFDHASLKRDSITVPIVQEKKIIYTSRPEDGPTKLPHPLFVSGFLLIMALILSVKDFYTKKLSNWFDVFLFGSTGIIGVLLLFLWLFTDHKAAAYNFNLLWALPTHLVALAAFRKAKRWLEKYFLIVVLLEALLLLTWWFLPQQLNTSLIPLVLTLLLRALLQYAMRKQAALQ